MLGEPGKSQQVPLLSNLGRRKNQASETASDPLFNGFAAGDEMIVNARYRLAKPHDRWCADPQILAHGPICGGATGVITLCEMFFDPDVTDGYRLWAIIEEALHLAGASHATPESPGADRFPQIPGNCQVWN